MEKVNFIPHRQYSPDMPAERAARAFYETMAQRRTVRVYSDRPVSLETIETCVRAAGTAPSGAHKQPWRFVAVRDPEIKSKIRAAAEAEEREFYERKANHEWINDLAPFETNPSKPFLEIAPWIVIVFKMVKTDAGGQVYYVNESVGIAVGLFLAAAHHAGLATLTHTPSPMGFLSEVLGRPAHERAYVVIPVGYPADGCVVPKLDRKPLEEILVTM